MVLREITKDSSLLAVKEFHLLLILSRIYINSPHGHFILFYFKIPGQPSILIQVDQEWEICPIVSFKYFFDFLKRQWPQRVWIEFVVRHNDHTSTKNGLIHKAKVLSDAFKQPALEGTKFRWFSYMSKNCSITNVSTYSSSSSKSFSYENSVLPPSSLSPAGWLRANFWGSISLKSCVDLRVQCYDSV